MLHKQKWRVKLDQNLKQWNPIETVQNNTSRPAGEYCAERVQSVNGRSPSSSTRANMFLYGYQNPVQEKSHTKANRRTLSTGRLDEERNAPNQVYPRQTCPKGEWNAKESDRFWEGGLVARKIEVPWMPTSTERPAGVFQPATNPPGWGPASSRSTSNPCKPTTEHMPFTDGGTAHKRGDKYGKIILELYVRVNIILFMICLKRKKTSNGT